ncbi:hypothetical protein V3N99_21310 [Dermatophilaceae bacterium Soc4.6]
MSQLDDIQRLKAILGAWSQRSDATGDSPPSPAELEAVAEAMAVAPGGSPELERWRPVLEFYVTQVKLGVTDIPERLPPRVLLRVSPLMADGSVRQPPVAESSGGRPASTPADPAPLLDRLKQWQDAKAAAGYGDIGRLPDRALIDMKGALERSRGVDNAKLSRKLPEVVYPFLAELRALAGVGASAEPPAAPADALTADGFLATSAADVASNPTDGSAAGQSPTEPDPSEASRPQPGQPAPAQPTVSTRDLAFAAYLGDVPVAPSIPVAFDMGEGVVRSSWSPLSPASGVVIYRVVCRDDYPPFTPENARLVDVTTDPTAVDVEPQESILRHLQVWVNEGPDAQSAASSQPRLHAAGVVVQPLTGYSVNEDGNRVIGHWSAPAGAARVRVYRIPARLRPTVTVATLARYLIGAQTDHLGGFVDDDAAPGESYVYRLQVVAEADGQEHVGPAHDVVVTPRAVLTPVEDLVVLDSADGRIDLAWTAPPVGEVKIYRSPKGPAAGSEHRVLKAEALGGVGLQSDMEVRHPADAAHGSRRVRWTGVAWPLDLARMVLTPVTALGDERMIGTSRSAVRVPAVTDLRLIERVTDQTVTFPWPTGATAVFLYRGSHGGDPVQTAQSKPIEEVTIERYRRLGGVHLALRPEDDCRIVATAVSFDNGQRQVSSPTWVDRLSLVIIRYSCSIKKRLMMKPSHALVKVWSEVPVQGAPAFLCIHNPVRMPLHAGDGQALPVRLHASQDTPASTTFKPAGLVGEAATLEWRVDLGPLGGGPLGCLRVFPQFDPHHEVTRLARVVVLDPPVEQLRLGNW